MRQQGEDEQHRHEPEQQAAAREPAVAARAGELLAAHQMSIWRRTDRLFAGLLVFQWLGGIVLAMCVSPRTWEGDSSHVHPHVWAALFLGAGIILLPLVMISRFPGRAVTRHVIAMSQLLVSALLIHLGNGRIEMHFHVFGSLAFLAFYRDWRVLIMATVVVAADHFLRGMLIPQSVYGVMSVTVWRTLEHAAWVAFEDVFLIASCIQGVREMQGIAENRALLEHSYRTVEDKVRERTQQLKDAQENLVKMARSAGMAEIATSVLHNVGNVLNSVNVSASMVAEKLRQSEIASLVKVGEMIGAHEADMAAYLTVDERGKHVPQFIVEMAKCLADEQAAMLAEITTLSGGVEHIKQIVVAQQSLAKRGGGNVHTMAEPSKLMETAVTMQNSVMDRGGVRVVRRFEPIGAVPIEEHKVLQILINLISNAHHAVKTNGNAEKEITLSIAPVPDADGTPRAVRFGVMDNGVGIAPEHLTRIFAHGFTTKKEGHGFGLHSAANAAREMGGELTAASDGPGRGAAFTLEVPVVGDRVGATCSSK